MFKFLAVVVASIVGGNSPSDQVVENKKAQNEQAVIATDTTPETQANRHATDKNQAHDSNRSDSARRLTPQEKHKIERDVAQYNATQPTKPPADLREKIERAVVAPPGSPVDYRTTARNQAYNGNTTYEEQYRLDRGLMGKRLTPQEDYQMKRDVAQHNATRSTKPPAKKR